MAKEIDLSGIAAGVKQTNRARQNYLRDAFEDERNEAFGASFVKPFIQETVFEGPERKRKERLEIQMRDPNLIKQINDSKAQLIETRSGALRSTFDRIENHADGPEAGARIVAEELMANSEIGKTFLGSGLFDPNDPQYSFVSATLKNKMAQLYEDRINQQTEFVLKTHNEIKDSGILKDYDVSNAYKMSLDNYNKLSAGVSLDVESSDIFRQGINALFGDNDAADVANLYNQANMIQNKIDKFYEESEKFVKLNSTIVKVDDNLTTYLSAVNNLNEEDYKEFTRNSREQIDKINTDDGSELYKNIFTTRQGILAQWTDGDLDENGNYAANPTRHAGSRLTVNPFGMAVEDWIPFNDISAVAEENITYRERAVVDGKLVERDVSLGISDFRSFLGGMVTNVATGLKFEAERVGNTFAKSDADYLNAAYVFLAKNGYIRMKDANNIEKGLILVRPLSTSQIISGSGALSTDERERLGIDNLYNMSVNRTIKDAEEAGGGTDENFVPNMIANVEKDLEEEIDKTQDIEKREQLFLELDDINNSKLSKNETRRQILKQLIAPTESNQGKPYVYDEKLGLTYTAGQLTRKDAESIYKQLLIQNGVDSDPEIRGLIDVAKFEGDDDNSVDSQMLRLKDVDRPNLIKPVLTALSNFNARQQLAFDLKILQEYIDGNKTYRQPKVFENVFTKYNLGKNPDREKVQEFLRDNK
tara:strand:+ start:3992 stop:6106 length:2115 start_codon:yes stop_codon:yes gene_type:complete